MGLRENWGHSYRPNPAKVLRFVDAPLKRFFYTSYPNKDNIHIPLGKTCQLNSFGAFEDVAIAQ